MKRLIIAFAMLSVFNGYGYTLANGRPGRLVGAGLFTVECQRKGSNKSIHNVHGGTNMTARCPKGYQFKNTVRSKSSKGRMGGGLFTVVCEPEKVFVKDVHGGTNMAAMCPKGYRFIKAIEQKGGQCPAGMADKPCGGDGISMRFKGDECFKCAGPQ